MKTILYLHGFASSPNGRKIELLREALPPDEFQVIAPDLNQPSFERLDFEKIVVVALDAAEADPPAVVVGSSLGALVALEACRRGIHAPLVLIAPALGFGSRWTDKLAPGDPLILFHHGWKRELPIHRRFFEQMAKVNCDLGAPAAPVTILMGKKDKSVPFHGVAGVWRRWEEGGALLPGSRFIAIPDGDHGLVDHVGQIADAVRAAAATG